MAWAFAALDNGDEATALFQMLNPIAHSDSADNANRYQVEPYVIAADIYGVPPHVGRGGWTWYTGSASWMYRLGMEAILGLQRYGDQLRIAPHIPTEWPGYEMTYRFGKASYHIQVINATPKAATAQITLDGQALDDGHIPLKDDGHLHEVTVHL